jgi:putative flippase GtrA
MLSALRQRIPSREALWRESLHLLMYGFVGGSSFIINAGVYWVLSRVVWSTAPHWIVNIPALCIAAIYNFTLHRTLSFRMDAFSRNMVGRYLFVVIVSMAVNSTLFYIGNEVLKLYDLIVLVFAGGTVAVGTYFLHRLFTFHPGREKTTHAAA